MKNIEKKLVRQQLDKQLKSFLGLSIPHQPGGGWIHATRTSLGISLRQLAEKLGVSKSAIQGFERGELTKKMSVEGLEKVANAMNMTLVCFFLPKEGSLENILKTQARKKAIEIVKRTNRTMSLEDQATKSDFLKSEINRITEELVIEMPMNLWD